MKLLMIDVGNTTADFRIWDSQQDKITHLIRPLSNDKTYKEPNLIIELLAAKNITINKIVYVSVVPEWNEFIRSLGERLKVDVHNIRNLLDLSAKNIDIDDSSKLGADFLCNFYAAKAMYNFENGIIVSMGTATTFLLVQAGVIIGTIIAPGVETALKGLISNTALLPDNKYTKSTKLIGKNTKDAIDLGAYNCHFLMTKAVVNDLAAKYQVGQIIYTGGNSILFEKEITDALFKHNEQLIFSGIVAIFKQFVK